MGLKEVGPVPAGGIRTWGFPLPAERGPVPGLLRPDHLPGRKDAPEPEGSGASGGGWVGEGQPWLLGCRRRGKGPSRSGGPGPAASRQGQPAKTRAQQEPRTRFR